MRGRHLFALTGVLLVAACLRPAITSVGPLLDQIGLGTGLGHSWLGLLGAVPLLMFASCSLFATSAAQPRGMEAAVLGALVLLGVGIVVRSAGGPVGLWIGTAVAGGAVAVANVLTPALVKRDFAKPTLVMAAFASTLSGFAAIASGTAVPLSHWLGGWREGLAFWLVLPLAVAPLWAWRMIRLRSPTSLEPRLHPDAVRRMWRSPIAWQVTLFFGLQSGTFYTVVTWLPSVEHAFGVTAEAAGLHLLLYQVLGSACGLALGALMERHRDQRLAAVAVSLTVVVAMLGMALAPRLVVLWVVIASGGAGPALTVALALVVLRTSTSEEAAALSGMAQSVGYLIAAAGPVVAGLIADMAGWTMVLVCAATIAIAQTVLGLWAGRITPVHPARQELHGV